MARAATGKRIVLATYGSPGDVQPFLAIGMELRARGHDPVVATSEHYRQAVAATGLTFAPIRPDRSPGQQDPDFLDRLLRDREPPRAIFRAMFLPSPRDSFEDMLRATEGVDGIVSHTLTPAARLAAEMRRLPWVSAVMQPMGYLSAHEPPVVGFPWVAAGLRAAGPGPTARVLRGVRRLTQRWAGDWHELRSELGLPPVSQHPLWEGQHAPRQSLGLFPRLLGSPQLDWPPQARVTGFPFYRAPDRVLDPAVERFLAGGDPPLVFTLGTTAVNDPGPFYAVSAAAARLLGRRALLLGGRRDAIPLSGRSDDVLTAPYAPHDLVFPRGSVIVHQGGIGTLSEALLAGKPMLIMPYGHDQADNAWRASRLGVAQVIPRRRFRAHEVSRALANLLRSPERGEMAASASRAVARERGASVAADMILEALSSSF
ncbi:MAG: glycosyltransferase [Thermomicrobiales bacterium]